MPPTPRLRRRALLALAGLFFLPACGGSPAKPTQIFDAPKLACPAPVSASSPLGVPLAVNYAAASVTGGTPPVIVSCTPPDGSIFPIGTTAVACLATDQVQRTATCAFTVTVTAPPRLVATRFLAYGDSITWGEDGITAALWHRLGITNHPANQLTGVTYPDDLQVALSARYTGQSPLVTNDGERGDTVLATDTQDTFHTRYVPAVTSGQYDVVLLMEGANDLSGSDLTQVNATVGGIGVMVQTAQNYGLRVLLATIPPENPTGYRGGNAASVAPYNDGLRQLATRMGVPLVDVYAAFAGNLSLLGDDGLHPNAAGYQAVAQTFFNAIKQNLEVTSMTLSMPGGGSPLAPQRRR